MNSNPIGMLAIVTILLAGCGGGKAVPDKQDAETSPVTYHKRDDPEMLKASVEARKTFKYFWKEVALDFNRIVPALEMACIKKPFSDNPADPNSSVEHMWVEEINFDGERISGVLINSPNGLKSVKQGDKVEFSPAEIGDWMCVLGDKVYGGYTVQVIRGRMSEEERAAHDEGWGRKFPPPEKVLVPPGTSNFEPVIAEMLEKHLKEKPETMNSKDDAGRTPLHTAALFGRKLSVKILLKHKADPTKKCKRGWTPIDYAKALNWSEIIKLLEAAKAKPDK